MGSSPPRRYSITMSTRDDTDDKVTWYEIAQETGITVRSLRSIKYRSDLNRQIALETGDDSFIKPGDLPPEDGYIPAKGRPGRPRPYWSRDAVEAWKARKGA